MSMHPGAVLLALGLGLLVSAVEAFSRYRDEPFKAVLGSAFGWVYLLLNAGLSVLAYWLLLLFQEPVTATLDHLKLAAIAGLGAAAILRSRISFRMGKKEIPIDPGIVIDRLLAVIDEQIARARFPERMRLVREMAGLDFGLLTQQARVDVRRGRQGPAAEKRGEVVKTIREIEGGELSEDQKVRELGFVLLDHMGKVYVRELIAEVRARRSTVVAGRRIAGRRDANVGTYGQRRLGDRPGEVSRSQF